MTIIRFENVVKTHLIGTNVFTSLKGINLTINRGELVAIIGPSGSGKTSTMNIMGLLDHPTSGYYYLEDIDVAQFTIDQLATLRNQKIGFIFQSFFLLPKLTALQNVGLPLWYRGVDSKIIRNLSQAMLERVGMGKHGPHRPNEMSGGQQQRVAIARALIGDPSIILADEPTGALDVNTSHKILTLLVELNKTEGTTIVIITHDPDVANQCSRIIQIYDGQIKE